MLWQCAQIQCRKKEVEREGRQEEAGDKEGRERKKEGRKEGRKKEKGRKRPAPYVCPVKFK